MLFVLSYILYPSRCSTQLAASKMCLFIVKHNKSRKNLAFIGTTVNVFWTYFKYPHQMSKVSWNNWTACFFLGSPTFILTFLSFINIHFFRLFIFCFQLWKDEFEQSTRCLIRTEHVTKNEYKTFSKGLIFYLYIISSCRCRDQRTTTINIIDSKQPAITKFMVA